MKYTYYLSYLIRLFFTRATFVSKKVHDIRTLSFSEDIQLVIFDLDDTLTAHHSQLSEDVLEYLQLLTKNKHVAFLSNSRSKALDTVRSQVESSDIYFSSSHSKPAPQGFYDVLEHFQIKPENTAMVGDLIISDMYGAWRVGINERALVAPYSSYLGGRQADIWLQTVRRIERSWYRLTRSS